MNKLLVEGWILGEEKPVVTFCQNLLELEAALWTFTRVEHVEPTNNFMERSGCRPGLVAAAEFRLRRRLGCRFVERILTVVQTRATPRQKRAQLSA